jgi:hypothetical protein
MKAQYPTCCHLHIRRRENLKSHLFQKISVYRKRWKDYIVQGMMTCHYKPRKRDAADTGKEMLNRFRLCLFWCCSCRCGESMSLSCGLLFITQLKKINMESAGRITRTGETQKTGRKTCPSASLSITNPTWTDLGT